jgi:hypothetical protein
MIDQGKSTLLLKCETQILLLPPSAAETLNLYNPPETLNMINNSAWMDEASESPETP